MDCEMPKMDGYTATGRIRELEPEGEHVPIIAITAHAIEGSQTGAWRLGWMITWSSRSRKIN
jgi:CheY-like chemotaxis protein